MYQIDVQKKIEKKRLFAWWLMYKDEEELGEWNYSDKACQWKLQIISDEVQFASRDFRRRKADEIPMKLRLIEWDTHCPFHTHALLVFSYRHHFITITLLLKNKIYISHSYIPSSSLCSIFSSFSPKEYLTWRPLKWAPIQIILRAEEFSSSAWVVRTVLWL